MKTDLYIPKTIKVGYQKRKDTFTGKLAYIIYYDEKNILRKETSWNKWRDQSIDCLEIENSPLSGFVFNKGIEKYGYDSQSGRSVARVHDPREFEFEISIENMFGIMMNNDIHKRDIQGEFVYAWSGSELILLPTNSKEYKDSQRHTEKQSKKISTKDLVKGRVYSQKKDKKNVTYFGYHTVFEKIGEGFMTNFENKGKKHLFYFDDSTFTTLKSDALAECISEDMDQNYTKMEEKFNQSYMSNPYNEIIQETPNSGTNKLKGSNRISFYKNYGEATMHHLIIGGYGWDSEQISYSKEHDSLHNFYILTYQKINGEYELIKNHNKRHPDELAFINDIFQDSTMTIKTAVLVDQLKNYGYNQLYLFREGCPKIRL